MKKKDQNRQLTLKQLEKLLFHSCRMLLIAKGIEAGEKKEIFEKFKLHFVESGLVSSDYLALLEFCLEFCQKKEPPPFHRFQSTIKDLAADVLKLYQSMDDSLRFPGEREKTNTSSPNDQFRFKDLRGVPCPMNFVKTKLALAKLNKGDRLDILLDDGEPINNVPISVEEEGHLILEKMPVENYWQVMIEK